MKQKSTYDSGSDEDVNSIRLKNADELLQRLENSSKGKIKQKELNQGRKPEKHELNQTFNTILILAGLLILLTAIFFANI